MRIKLSFEGLVKAELSQFTGNSAGEIDGCEFFVDSQRREADAWFIVEDVNPEDANCLTPPEQVHFLSAETSYSQSHYFNPSLTEFLAQFSAIHSCHPVPLANSDFEPPFLPWMINANHESIFRPHSRDLHFFENLVELEKSKPMSVFCSSQDYTPDHKLRLAFAAHLKAYFGNDIEWYGNGVNAIPEKWDGLAAYERTIVLENRSDRGVYSEKILDPFLALTQPIYWGAPDIMNFLPVHAEHQLDIRDFKGATQAIKRILENPVTVEEKDRLLEGKELATGRLHFLRRIAHIAKTRASQNLNNGRTQISLAPRGAFRELFQPVPHKKSLADHAYVLARRLVKGH